MSFRLSQYCKRYEYVSFSLQHPIVTPANNAFPKTKAYWFRYGLMLLWLKNLMNVAEKLQFIDPTFRHSSD